MERTIDIENERSELNEWVKKSIELFESPLYLDNILDVYPLQTARPERLNNRIRRRIISAHQGRRTTELIEILKNEIKFPYDEPLWYLIKTFKVALRSTHSRFKEFFIRLSLCNDSRRNCGTIGISSKIKHPNASIVCKLASPEF